MKRNSLVLVLFAAALSFAIGMNDADAKRLGGGTSIGRQSQSVNRGPAPAAQPQAAPRPVQPPPAAAPAQAPNRWLGPLAGLAAGFGLAALFSHFGMGGVLASAMGSLLILALLAVGVILIVRLFRNSPGAAPRPAYAGVDPPMYPRAAPAALARSADSLTADSVAPAWTIPADMNAAEFTHAAKVMFLRLQAASDTGDLADIRTFTTPEMYAEAQLQIGEREGRPNRTEVFRLDAQLLGVEEVNSQRLASVRFYGTIREEAEAPAERFSEIWNFSQDANGRWLLAGIQQAS